MQTGVEKYFRVYDFTNENVACLKNLYNFENAKVLSIVGSGDQYFSSLLYGSNEVDLFDINPTSELYTLLKFYAIRELNYEEFINFMVKKDFTNFKAYNKLERVVPIEILKYLRFLIVNKTKRRKKDICFRRDGITIQSRTNKKYYFNKNQPIIPYLIEDNYYKLQEILKNTKPPKVFHKNITHIKKQIKGNYDILLLSNVYEYLECNVDEFTDILYEFDIPEIQGCYDWFGTHYILFKYNGYKITKVAPSSPFEFNEKFNYVYSLKK